MKPEAFKQVRELFHQAMALGPDDRPRLLASADPEIRVEVESLLASHDASDQFMARPAALSSGATPTEEGDPLIGFVLSSYRITGVLGVGGMGAVYRAEQVQPRRIVALKVIRAGWNTPSLRRRFAHETEALGRLRHPGIAQIFEAGSAAGPDGREMPFIAMELVEGAPLTAFAAAHSLAMRDRLSLFSLVCDAVHHAHQNGIIHRDIKPANILVEELGRSGLTTSAHPGTQPPSGILPTGYAPSTYEPSPFQPKVLDFGIARLTSTDVAFTTMHTDPGQIVGTLAYMSPEQVRGETERVDVRSDIYALGVLLFELLTGRLPYDVRGKSVPDAARLVTEEEPTLPGTVDRRLRGDLETVILKAIAREPERRYQSAHELAADIRRFLGDLPVVARPATTVYQLRKFARRNRTLVVGVCAAFVLLILGVIGTSIGLVRASDAKTKALAAASRAERANSYLRGTLGWFKPGQAQSPTVSLKDVLDAAGARIDKELADQPDVAAFMHTTVGEDYLSLADFDKAEAHAAKALEWVDRAGLGECEEMLGALRLRASTLSKRGDFAGAEKVVRQLIGIRLKTLPDNHPLVSKDRIDLGGYLRGMKRTTEAEQVLTPALEVLRADGHYPSAVMSGDNELAMLVRRAQPKRAIELMKEANDLARISPDVTEEERAVLTNNLATALKDDGDDIGAERGYNESLELRRRIYGEDHAAVALVYNNLGTVYAIRGDWAKAEGFYNKALEMRRRLLGPEHRMTLNTIENIARLYEEQGAVEQAAKMFKDALDIRIRVDGRQAPDTAGAAINHASLIDRLGRSEEALAEARQACETLRKTLGDKSVEEHLAFSRLAGILSNLGRHEEAEPIMRETAAWMDANATARWGDLSTAHASLSRELRIMGRAKEAESEARIAVNAISPHAAPGSLVLAGANLALGWALVNQQLFVEAEAPVRAALESYTRAMTGSSARVGACEFSLGEVLLGLGRRDQAEKALLSALAHLHGQPDGRSGEAALRKRLAALYQDWGRPDEAAKFADPTTTP